MLEPYEETLTISLTRYNGLIRKSVQYDFIMDMILESGYLNDWGKISFGSWTLALLLKLFEPEAVAEREADLKAKRLAEETVEQIKRKDNIIKGGDAVDR